MTEKQDEFITTAEAAEILGYAYTANVRKLILDGELTASKRRGGRDWQIKRSDLDKLLSQWKARAEALARLKERTNAHKLENPS